jgi:hypothetical protein
MKIESEEKTFSQILSQKVQKLAVERTISFMIFEEMVFTFSVIE